MDHVLYEQPTSELIRVCLRIEHCLEQLSFYCNNPAYWDSYHAVAAVIELLNILDRPDLKSKLIQEVKRQLDTFTKLTQRHQIDKKKLETTLEQLERGYQFLTNFAGKFGDDLRQSKTLEHIRQLTLSSACPLPSPLYRYWLSRSPETRIADLLDWQSTFDDLQRVVRLLLRLIRYSGVPRIEKAVAGFYQQNLDPANSASCQLIRVELPLEFETFPEISVGKHRLSIRFLKPTLTLKTSQIEETLEFKLTCCFL